MQNFNIIVKKASELKELTSDLADKLREFAVVQPEATINVDQFFFGMTVFVLACFIGYYVVWKVTPALHTPLMAVTNAISGIIIIGAMLAIGAEDLGPSTIFGFIAVFLAAINIFGGFIVTNRMLAMFKKNH